MTKEPSTPIPPSRRAPTVQQFKFMGSRDDIAFAVRAFQFPATWGPAAVVRAFVCEHLPLPTSWRGHISVSGYSTQPNDQGSGTVYVSVSWVPER